MRALLIASPFFALALWGVASNVWAGDEEESNDRGRLVSISSNSGPARNFAVGNFDAVSLDGPDDVRVVYGAKTSVSATGDPDTLDKLEIRVVGNLLKIGRKGDSLSIGWRDNGDDPVVTVTMPLVRSVEVGGSGNMSVGRVEIDAFSAAVGGSGDLELTSVKAKTINLTAGGSGSLKADGQAEMATMSAGGSGDIRAEDLTSVRAAISVGGSGDVRTTVTGNTTIDAGGSGDVTVRGSGTCTIRNGGSGDARCGGG
jgi:Putative auto-transporter adhesin, head GIN domain